MPNGSEHENPLGGNIPATFRLNEVMKLKFSAGIAELQKHPKLKDAQHIAFEHERIDCSIAGSDSISPASLYNFPDTPEEYHPNLMYFDVFLFKDGQPYKPFGQANEDAAYVIVTGDEMPPKMFQQEEEIKLIDPEIYPDIKPHMLNEVEAEAVIKVLNQAKPESVERHVDAYGSNDET
ncbi:MAG TPA: hypothetical protein VLF39_00360 [Candidatus Saccharimonadales bacterium]|nr:hypothetical protein [Candidatus Saccharimonadales bacterium]